MKIGLFTDGYLPEVTGVATSVDAAASELESRGHTVVIVAPKYPKYADTRQVIRIRSVVMPSKKDLRVATYLPGTSLLLANQLDLDIIHGHAGGPVTMLGWEVARIKRIPFLLTYHTLFAQYTHYFLKGKVIKPKMIEVVTRLSANAADHVIAPTNKIKVELESYGIKKPISVIPTGINLQRFHPHRSNFLHQKANLGPNRRILLYLGRLGKEKSVDYLLKSFALITKEVDDVDLVLVGDGPERRNLEKMSRELGIERRTHFIGFIDPSQTPLAYSDAALLVFCSTSETQGLAIPEAMACGLPPVVVKDPAYREIVKHGYNGVVAKRGNKGFAQAVCQTLADPKLIKELSKNAQKTVSSYSLDKSVDNLERLYHQLIIKK